MYREEEEEGEDERDDEEATATVLEEGEVDISQDDETSDKTCDEGHSLSTNSSSSSSTGSTRGGGGGGGSSNSKKEFEAINEIQFAVSNRQGLGGRSVRAQDMGKGRVILLNNLFLFVLVSTIALSLSLSTSLSIVPFLPSSSSTNRFALSTSAARSTSSQRTK